MDSTSTNDDLMFSAEHEEFRSVIRSLVEDHLNPYVDAWEASGAFPAHEVFPKFGAVGALGLEYPTSVGGQDADHSFTVVLAEELGRCDAGGPTTALAVQVAMATPALARFGSPELQQRFLAPAIAGTAVGAVAVSEPEAGSDVASIRTKAVRDGDNWVINGRKMWITNGAQADWVCLLARTSEAGGHRGMSLIIVPTNSPGFAAGRTIAKLGQHSSDSAELIFDDVRVPVAHTVGDEGNGFVMQMAQFQDERLFIAYLAAAGARRALDRTAEYLARRVAFGEPLLANRYLQYSLAELVAEVDLLRGFLRHTAARYAAGQNVTREATIAKFKAGRLSRQVADACLQFHGGMGYAEEMWTARYYRDSRATAIAGGADEVMLRVIAQLEGYERLLRVG